jgi:hypothetical protein
VDKMTDVNTMDIADLISRLTLNNPNPHTNKIIQQINHTTDKSCSTTRI